MNLSRVDKITLEVYFAPDLYNVHVLTARHKFRCKIELVNC